jgi:predicted O-methyltransferase YrrM
MIEAREVRWGIKGWQTQRELERLVKLGAECPAGSWVVEVGGYQGLSAAALLEGLKSKGEGRLLTVEPDPAARALLGENLRGQGWEVFAPATMTQFLFHCCHEKFALNPMTRALPVAVAPGKNHELAGFVNYFWPVGVLFIDADHEQAAQDLRIWRRALMSPGGKVAFHDWGQPAYPAVRRDVAPFFTTAPEVTDYLAVFPVSSLKE